MPGNDLYVENTATDGPSIVFLHGGGLSGRMWRPVERLAAVAASPDLPEQGAAQIKPFTLDDAPAASRN